MPSRFLARAVAVLLLAHGPGLSAAAATPAELAIKAAYLFNFALYTEWPTPPVDAVGICIAGPDPFGSALDAIAGKPLRGKPLIIHRLENSVDFSGCHVVYVNAASNAQRARIARALDQKPVLSVADSADEAFRPMVLLVPDGNRFAFEVELAVAKTTGLTLGSQMLRLARVVR